MRLMTSRSDQEQSRNDETQLIITPKNTAILPRTMPTDTSVVWVAVEREAVASAIVIDTG